MSRYTTQLRYYIEMNSDDTKTVKQRISEAREKLFDFGFPIWNESHRVQLEEKIIKHYYFYEIGFETFGHFKFYLDMKLNEIMPKYNKLYEAIEKYDNVFASDFETVNETVENDDTSNSTGNTSTQHVESDTPQAHLSTTDYASFISEDTGNTANGVIDHGFTERETKRTKNSGDLTELMNKYAEQYNDIDMLIINELKPLFFESVLLY